LDQELVREKNGTEETVFSCVQEESIKIFMLMSGFALSLKGVITLFALSSSPVTP
jgi:hypothetical protein